MTATSDYLSYVIPANQSFDEDEYAGVFHFKFWQFNNWIDVVVDDYLPVDSDNNLIFCKNVRNENEFFICLLEKAYAKLRGCYEFMHIENNPINAIIDMTGLRI